MEPPRNTSLSDGKTAEAQVEEMTTLRDEAVSHGHDLDALLQAVETPMVVYDLQTQIMRINPAFRAVLETYSHTTTGTLQDRVSGLDLRDLHGEVLTNEESPSYRMLHGETLTDADPAQILTRGAGGVEGVFSVTGRPLYRDNTLYGAVAFFRDITEQRQLESDLRRSQSDLRQSQEELHAVFDTLSDPLFLYNASGNLARTNPAARRMLPKDSDAYSANALPDRGNPYHVRNEQGHLLSHEEWPITRLLRGETLEGGEDATIHVDLPDGRDVFLSYTGSPMRDSDGRISGYVALGRDITKRVQIEAELRRAHDELEQRVSERTHDLSLANKELRRLSQRILEIQESERRLIARELHDEIGQQLTGAKMLLGDLVEQLQETRRKPSSERAGEAGEARVDEQKPSVLEQIDEVHALLGNTLEDVRDLSLELRPAVLDSLGLVPALRWLFGRYTKQTGVQVDFAADGLDYRLPTHLEAGVYRIIQEALTNVARYANVSAVTVQVYVTEETLSLYAVDSGTGFDVEEALAVGDSTGLAGMRERADLLGGTLTVDSLPGEGTTVQAEFSITRAIAEEAALETEQADGQQPEEEAARHHARDDLRDRARDQWRDAGRDAKRDTVRDVYRDSTRDTSRDRARDAARDASRDVAREASRDALQDQQHDQQEEWKEDEL